LIRASRLAAEEAAQTLERKTGLPGLPGNDDGDVVADIPSISRPVMMASQQETHFTPPP